MELPAFLNPDAGFFLKSVTAGGCSRNFRKPPARFSILKDWPDTTDSFSLKLNDFCCILLPVK